MKTAVLFPWSGTCPHRTAAFAWVKAWYAEHHPDFELVTGHSPEGEQWCKAKAVAEALVRTDADLLVISDADVVAPRLAEAVETVKTGISTWAIPHWRVLRFGPAATGRILKGADPKTAANDMDDFDQPPYKGLAGGGIVVLTRPTYLSAPLDPRFVGWGQEDESWAIALRTLHGQPWRSKDAPLWHLWHPPQQRESRSRGSHRSWNIYNSYCRAATPKDMPQCLAHARELVAGETRDR